MNVSKIKACVIKLIKGSPRNLTMEQITEMLQEFDEYDIRAAVCSAVADGELEFTSDRRFRLVGVIK